MTEHDGPRTYCRYRVRDQVSYGIIEDGQVFELDSAPFRPHNRTHVVHELAAVKLLVPTNPRAFLSADLNYSAHLGYFTPKQQAASKGRPPATPKTPEVGYRSNTALIAHDDEIVKPRDSTEKLHYEGELVAVFGKAGKNIPREDALNYVFGWTIGNDVTERTWQSTDVTMWRSKNSDTFKPMGPWIVTGLAPDEMVTTVQVNGMITDRFHTGDMNFDVATYISEITKYITIRPGDVLWMGTKGTSPELRIGDVIEIEITGIGTLRNRIVADDCRPRTSKDHDMPVREGVAATARRGA